MLVLKVMVVAAIIIIAIFVWAIVTGEELPTAPLNSNESEQEDAPEILAGSEMPKEMVDAIADKPKRGRPRKKS